MKTIICDLDGTLARDDHRNHHIQKPVGERDWDTYFSLCGGDRLHVPVAHLLRHLATTHFIVILTGRIDRVKTETIEWLERHQIPYDKLIMRPTNNRIDDHKWKVAMAAPFREDVIFVLEDRQRVVDAWRANGFTCFQVAPGDF